MALVGTRGHLLGFQSVMTLERRWTTQAFNAAVGLVIFVAWLGGAYFHVHDVASPSCKVCQALQSNQAALATPGATPRPSIADRRVPIAATPQSVEPHLLVPQGRAPPLV